MSRVRYEVYLGGRLLKVVEQIDVTTGMPAEADGTEFIDGQHFWMVDQQRVSDDVAQAMIARWRSFPEARRSPMPAAAEVIYRAICDSEGTPTGDDLREAADQLTAEVVAIIGDWRQHHLPGPSR